VILGATVAPPASRLAARRLARRLADVHLWVGGPAAEAVLTSAGTGARLIEDLEHLVEGLSRRVY
jgi:hypothetical protein